MDLVVWLNKWQTLIGTIIGGIFALLTALIVAWSAAQRARRTAADLIMMDLLPIMRAYEVLESLAKKDEIGKDDYPLWIAEKLSWSKPNLSSSYDVYVANLLGIHNGLSAHLSLMKMIYSGLNDHLTRVENDIEDRKAVGLPRIPRSPEATHADAKIVADGLKQAGAHASCAVHLIQQLVMSSTPTLNRIQMLICPSPMDVQSMKLLKEGSI
jgi:hypothetical protein